MTIESSRPSERPARSSRGFLIALWSLAAVLMVPIVGYGRVVRIEYDGWLQIFIATSDRWAHVSHDVFINTHPPLYFLLLRAVSWFGESVSAFRSIGWVATFFAIVLIGWCFHAATASRTFALIAAGAFGSAIATVYLANEVRQYMVSVMFMLLVLYGLIRMLQEASFRHRLLVAAAGTLAVLSHYGTVFFIAAAVFTLLVLRFFRTPAAGRWSRDSLRPLVRDLSAFAMPIGTFLAAYFLHVRRFPGPLNHLPEHYPAAGESVLSFAGRSLRSELALFLPFRLEHAGTALLVTGLITASLVAWILYSLRDSKSSVAPVLPLLFLGLAGLVFVAGVAGKYPFGGALRHQYFLFPLAVLTLSLAFLEMASLVRNRWSTAALATIAIALIAANAAWGWQHIWRPIGELFAEDEARFAAIAHDVDAVYLDSFGTIGFYPHHTDRQWEFINEAPGGLIRILKTRWRSREVFIFRDRGRWNPTLDDPRMFQEIRQALDRVGGSRVGLMRIDQQREGHATPPAEVLRELSDSMQSAAALAGLRVLATQYEGHGTYAVLEIERRGAN
ncbi:MAG TPA: glycosyltransferase family 39 protein [Thermoanaerobaculia bacterium]